MLRSLLLWETFEDFEQRSDKGFVFKKAYSGGTENNNTKATNRKQETEKIYRYVDREILNMKMHKIMSYRSNYQYLLDHRESKRVPEKHVLLLY